MKFNKRFRKNPRYVHQRSEGLTRRGADRQERLMLGPARAVSFLVSRGLSLRDAVNAEAGLAIAGSILNRRKPE